ncbi:MAG TPA: hypothetical protein VLT82_11490 [Myxococcaceae bacterium]|nr:hypothetical protein [Myxococcaceae bacterium]
MSRICVVVGVTSLWLGCGSGAGSLDGKVHGHEVSVKEAVFIQLDSGDVIVAAGDQENLCGVLNGQQRPSHEMNLLEVGLVNWNGSSTQPLVTGSYTVARSITAAGLYAYAILFWTSECLTFGALGTNGGSVTVDSVGLAQAGGHTAISVALTFGDDHLSGHLDATYCPLAAATGTACQPQLRARPLDTE